MQLFASVFQRNIFFIAGIAIADKRSFAINRLEVRIGLPRFISKRLRVEWTMSHIACRKSLPEEFKLIILLHFITIIDSFWQVLR